MCSGGHQVGDRRPRVLAGDERLTDEHDVAPVAGVLEDVMRAADAGLGDPDDAVRDLRGEPGERVDGRLRGS